jgi:hypothetical protein
MKRFIFPREIAGETSAVNFLEHVSEILTRGVMEIKEVPE